MLTKYPIGGNKFISKTWGYERHIINFDKYCGKELFIAKGKFCSFHYHKLKTETFFVSKGKLGVVCHTAMHDDNDNLITDGLIKNCRWHSNNPGYWTNIEFDRFPYSVEICNLCCQYYELEAGDSLHLSPYNIHRFYGWQDTTFYEFSTQSFDDDSYRILPTI